MVPRMRLSKSALSNRRWRNKPFAVFLFVALAVGAWIVSWAVLRPGITNDEHVRIPGLTRPVRIMRDAYGIPHIQASTLHDAYVAEGYVVAQDRLFQLDLLRRLIGGELSEVFGNVTLESDMRHRRMRPRELARRMYTAMSLEERAASEAYVVGVNAAMERESLPVEFRTLLYRPQPWKAEDSVLVGLATVQDLTNDWDMILAREQFNRAIGRNAVDELIPISDPAYDVPLSGLRLAVSCHPPVHVTPPRFSVVDPHLLEGVHPQLEASNAWAVGGAHTVDGHALVASDPHLDYSVPGPWYLVDVQAPGLHVAGAVLPGTPGVLIGHNGAIAWGITSATVSTVTVYREPLSAVHVVERQQIQVRFGKPVSFDVKATGHGFIFAEDAHAAYAAQWVTDHDARSPLGTFLALDRASSLEEALRALAHFPGPVLNFTLGERDGRVAYHMAGDIPIDGVWSRYVVSGMNVKNAWHGYVPFASLPHVDPSRDAIVFTANNRVYGAGYPYRLTDHFGPAYRANRIHALLFSGKRMSSEDMQRLQLDDVSLPEREFARGVVNYIRAKKDASQDERVVAWALRGWDGRMHASSHEATLVHRMLKGALARYAALVLGEKLGPAWLAHVGEPEATASMLCALREHAVHYAALLDARTVQFTQTPWGQTGAVAFHHPLRALGITLFDPPIYMGAGDFASVKVQTNKHGQGLRAVWDVGVWDRGGAILPLGESGRPWTAHYDDEQPLFTKGALLPLL
jgi:penicillin G amidase